MSPDLGKYAMEVLMAYGVTLFLLVFVSGYSWWRSALTRRQLLKTLSQRDRHD